MNHLGNFKNASWPVLVSLLWGIHSPDLERFQTPWGLQDAPGEPPLQGTGHPSRHMLQTPGGFDKLQTPDALTQSFGSHWYRMRPDPQNLLKKKKKSPQVIITCGQIGEPGAPGS